MSEIIAVGDELSRLLYDCCMIVVWMLYECCMIVVWLLCDCCMIVVWLLHDWYDCSNRNHDITTETRDNKQTH